MTTIPKTGTISFRQINFNWNVWVNDHITRSWPLTVWLVILTFITFRYTLSRLEAAPISSLIILIVWAISVAVTVYAELIHRHTSVTLWLKNNLYSSITNIMLTLVIMLGIVAAIFGLFNYAVETASFRATSVTDLRAEVSSVTASEYCFQVGRPDANGDQAALQNARTECFPRQAFVPDLSETDITQAALGEEAAQFCFDTVRDDPENGRYCFESVAANPGLFTLSIQFSGANWGAVWANLTNMLVFRFDRDELWRAWLAASFGVILAGASFFVYRERFKGTLVRQLLTYLWLASPIIFYVLLAGVPPVSLQEFATEAIPYVAILVVTAVLWLVNRSVTQRYPPYIGESELIRLGRIILTMLTGIAAFLAFLSLISLVLLVFGLFSAGGEPLFVPLKPDVDWGGFMLTLIITAFAIVVSFPIGVLMALGRRSTIPGIPGWITYPAALIIMALGLYFSTPQLVADARNSFELVVAYWPLIVPVIAILFQRVWKGNVVSGFCTMYIEFIRGIPLITVLFLSIILFPIFLPPDMEVLKTWRVMFAFALFAAAYLAENVRGGLQAIPKGQYEAADSLGLSTFNKYRLIIMPQALRTVIPAITNQYIGLFKDTTLVAIVGLLDILGVANSISAQPQWFGVRREAYLFIAVLYFIISAFIAGYAARLEKQTGLGER